MYPTKEQEDILAQFFSLFGQMDCYDQLISSVEAIEVGYSIPMSLQKFTAKIERSGYVIPVSDGSRKAARSLVVQ